MDNLVQPRDWAEDLVREVVRNERLGVRLLGGRAVRHLARGRVPEFLLRPPGDLDLFTNSHHRKQVQQWLESMGLMPEREFNLLNGRRRLMYWCGKEKIDVFVDEFRMCHVLDVGSRLHLQPVTLPLADLALTKLQIVEFTEKDMRDTLALLLAAHLTDHDEPGAFNVRYFGETLARDWGLWRTVTRNLQVLEHQVGTLAGEDEPATAELHRRLQHLTAVAERTPKTSKWKLRAVVGERVRWYELPEEP